MGCVASCYGRRTPRATTLPRQRSFPRKPSPSPTPAPVFLAHAVTRTIIQRTDIGYVDFSIDMCGPPCHSCSNNIKPGSWATCTWRSSPQKKVYWNSTLNSYDACAHKKFDALVPSPTGVPLRRYHGSTAVPGPPHAMEHARKEYSSHHGLPLTLQGAAGLWTPPGRLNDPFAPSPVHFRTGYREAQALTYKRAVSVFTETARIRVHDVHR